MDLSALIFTGVGLLLGLAQLLKRQSQTNEDQRAAFTRLAEQAFKDAAALRKELDECRAALNKTERDKDARHPPVQP